MNSEELLGGINDSEEQALLKREDPPKPVSKHEERVSYLHDLFMDLIIVSSFSFLGNFFQAGFDNDLAWYYPYVSLFAVFMPIILHWQNITLYANRFEKTTDSLHQFFNLVNTSLVLCAMLNLDDCSQVGYLYSFDNVECSGYSYSMTLLHCLMIVLYARIALLFAKCRNFALSRLVMHVIVAANWLLVATVGPLNAYGFALLWWSAVGIDYFWSAILVVMKRFWTAHSVPANVELLEERCGLLTMICFGVTLSGIGMVDADASNTSSPFLLYFNAALVACMVFLLRTMYLDVSVTYTEGGVHAINRSVVSAFSWMWLQIPLVFTTIVISITLRYGVLGDLQDEVTIRWAFIVNISLLLITLLLLQLCHRPPPTLQRIPLPVRMCIRFLCSLSFVLIGLIPTSWMPDWALLSTVVVILSITTFFDVYGRQKKEFT